MDDKRDLVILGGGLVGMTLALAAARKGISSHVVDRADPADLTAEGFDGRASAISTASWNLFRNIGLADGLERFACPIERIAVSDQLKPGRIDFVPEAHEGSLGRMFENRRSRSIPAPTSSSERADSTVSPRGFATAERSQGVCWSVPKDAARLPVKRLASHSRIGIIATAR